MTDELTGSRRSFIRGSLGLGVASATGATLPIVETLAEEPTERTLDAAETLTLRALMARIIPTDASGGGAVEAGADVYLDRALGGAYAALLPDYRAAFAALDRAAAGQRFAALKPAAMDALVGALEKGELRDEAFPDGGIKFFNMLRRHTVEGFLCDPMYGGNRDFLGWRTIGFSGIQLFYPEQTQALNGTDPRRQRSIADFGGSPI